MKDYGYNNGYDFDSLGKNNLPSQKETSNQNHGPKKFTGEMNSQYRNEGYNDTKPSSYSQQPPRNIVKKPPVQEKYDYYSKVDKNVRTPSTMNYSK